ncbi:energy transducer TonB [Hymenobacter coccineus]|uniref:TonB C-terminal domain-containing protein n=1 Tax=Hymenobacter coccineus TaxID=1908235 RepID=A0A1G1SX95_9BACT|nr:energy transducer TonB [Hymenobacter coccineus]OGX83219.1 hypothetical protein BEN49_12825 [Hymenobacter coccineus]
MKNLLLGIVAATLLLAGAPARAQTAVPAAAYAGPRFPGGPDSLRALVYRATRQAGTAPTGRVALEFKLAAPQQAESLRLVQPPRPVSKELLAAAAAAQSYLRAHMPNWQSDGPNQSFRAMLTLDFTTAAAAQPYNYADQEPVFPSLIAALHTQRNPVLERSMQSPAVQARLASPQMGLTTYIQMQTIYPVDAMRSRQQGQVLAYFEVAESGAIEHLSIVGTAGSALDAEVLRVAQTLPAATAPALLRGQPVRVYYVLPVTFRMQ